MTPKPNTPKQPTPKKVMLPNGELVAFPAETPDEIVHKVFGQKLGLPEGPSPEMMIAQQQMQALQQTMMQMQQTVQMLVQTTQQTAQSVEASGQQTAAAMRGIAQSMNDLARVAGQQMSLANAPKQPDQAVQGLADKFDSLAASVGKVGDQVVAALTKPKQLVFQDGKPVGVKVGN
jgi:uncharacterized protein YdiU (UPF0061 family)